MTVAVAVGVLRRADGAVLIAQRPAGKIAAGRWEFPGGKIEAGESPRAALLRELQEELGIAVTSCRPLIRIRHAYAERTVELHTWLIDAWAGEPHGLEGQSLAWCAPVGLSAYDLLAADAPIVHALRLPVELPVTPAVQHGDELDTGIRGILSAGHRLLRLRQPAMNDEQYRQCIHRLTPLLQAHDAGLLIDRAAADCALPGVAGLHLTAVKLQQHDVRPVPKHVWLFASCHDEAAVAQACRIGVDALVIGPVQSTATHPQSSPLGWSHFQNLALQANRPVYAIGGLNSQDCEQAHINDAQGIAAIRAYWKS